MTTFTSSTKHATALVELDPATWTPTGKVWFATNNGLEAFTFTASNIKIGTVLEQSVTSSTYGKPRLAIGCAVAVSAGTSGREGGAALTSPVTVRFIDQQGNVQKQDWS